jgi:hypothetical protein
MMRPPASPSCRFVLRARFQPIGFIGLQAGFLLVERSQSIQLGVRGSHRGLGLLLSPSCMLYSLYSPTRRAAVYEPEAEQEADP